ncbi:MAG: hypothetical protein IPF41_04900 [Flavobacteriales bacterium]|nr:hypothetical protein [Flavobacteriales bacterium]
MKHHIHVMAALVAVTTLASCQKYDDGPFFSLRTREERIANTWKVEKAWNGDSDITSSFEQYELKLKKNRDATLTAQYALGTLTFEFATSGTWDFENNSEDVRFDFGNDAADETYEILRLKETELWLREKDGDLELQLVPA